MRIFFRAALVAGLLFSAAAVAAPKLQPYVLGASGSGDVAAALAGAKQALTDAGFEVVGEYTPYEGASCVVVTNDLLKSTAAKSDHGGFGAVIRVAVTQVEGNAQVAYVNPIYLQNIFRLEGDLAGVKTALAEALGAEQEFGSKKGLTAKKLRKYHYMMMMPYFDDPLELAEHENHAEAVAAVDNGIAKGLGGLSLVYRVEIPGKDEVVFGVGISGGKGDDATVMGIVDQGELRHTAHLPYEMLVSGNEVFALHGKFRIAQSFPDLGMGTFMKINSAPGAIEDALRAAAGGQ